MSKQIVKQISEKSLSPEMQTLQKLFELYLDGDSIPAEENALKAQKQPEELLRLYFNKKNRG
ncbi:MAG: hypothetical protein JXA21_04415 [Anaerolineae bacterium]|nr:hypothetical protein [Anaerolineae bacterium]